MDYVQKLISLRNEIDKMEKFNGKAALSKKIGESIQWLQRYRADDKLKELFYKERMREFQQKCGTSAVQEKLPLKQGGADKTAVKFFNAEV